MIACCISVYGADDVAIVRGAVTYCEVLGIASGTALCVADSIGIASCVATDPEVRAI